MLCLLNLSDDERADTLGIARRSVSKIRYRLRIRIGLPEGSDVDEYLRKIMKE